MTVAGPLEQQLQQLEDSIQRRRGEQARRRGASTSTASPPSPGRRSRGQNKVAEGEEILCC